MRCPKRPASQLVARTASSAALIDPEACRPVQLVVGKMAPSLLAARLPKEAPSTASQVATAPPVLAGSFVEAYALAGLLVALNTVAART